MKWTREQLDFLITYFQNSPCLWDYASKDYKNRNKRNDAWVKISSDMDLPVDEVRRKMQSLLGQYRREKLKIKESKSGAGTQWFAFTQLSFMDGINFPRNTSDACLSKDIDDNSEPMCSWLEINLETPDEQILDNSVQSSTENLISPPSPPEPQPAKRAKLKDTSAVEEAVVVLKTMANRLQPIPKERSEGTIVGELVAARFDKLQTEFERTIFHNEIQKTLYKAGMGWFAEDKFRKKSTTNEI